MPHTGIKGKDLRKALKNRLSYVLVAGTESWVKVSHTEAIFLNEMQDGELSVDLEHPPHGPVSGRLGRVPGVRACGHPGHVDHSLMHHKGMPGIVDLEVPREERPAGVDLVEQAGQLTQKLVPDLPLRPRPSHLRVGLRPADGADQPGVFRGLPVLWSVRRPRGELDGVRVSWHALRI